MFVSCPAVDNICIHYHWSPTVKNMLLLLSQSVMSKSLWPHEMQHNRLPYLLPSPGAAQTHAHQAGGAIQPFQPLSSPSHPAFDLSQHQSLFQWVSSASGGQSIGASASASVFPMNNQGLFPLGLTGWSPCCPRDSQASSPAPQLESIYSSALSLLYDPTLTSIHDYWKNHSFDYTDLCWQSNVSAF